MKRYLSYIYALTFPVISLLLIYKYVFRLAGKLILFSLDISLALGLHREALSSPIAWLLVSILLLISLPSYLIFRLLVLKRVIARSRYITIFYVVQYLGFVLYAFVYPDIMDPLLYVVLYNLLIALLSILAERRHPIRA